MASDSNAKVDADYLDRDICGRDGLRMLNKQGERLLNFCRDDDLSITTTGFKYHERRRHTWQSQGGDYRNCIDCILVKNCWEKCLTLKHIIDISFFHRFFNLPT